MKGMRCVHGVLAGAWCAYCRTTVQALQVAATCGGCKEPVIARAGTWTRCPCGTQTIVLP